jgi:hypothetical protein
VASARQEEKSLPAAEAIQVWEAYFVEHGHHRISVTCALGQQEIEAEVTVWRVTWPSPRKKPVVVHSFTRQDPQLKRILTNPRDVVARLGVRFQTHLNNLLLAVRMKLRAQVVSWAVGEKLGF